MLEIPEAPTAQITDENPDPIAELTEVVKELDRKIDEVHKVMVFLGRKAQEMENTPLGKLLGGFGKKG